MYEDKFPNIDNTAKGLAVISLVDNANVYFNDLSYGEGVTVNKNTRVGILTGRWINQDNINYVQIYLEQKITGNNGLSYEYGFVDASQYRTVTLNGASYKSAVTLIQGLIANNKVILENNLLCAGMMDYMETNNIAIPVQYRKNLFALQKKLEVRNDKLINNPFISEKQTATPTGFSKYQDSLQTFMNNPGVGIIPVLAYIVVSVTFTLLVGAILYLIFKPDYTDSKADLKVSEDLTKALATLSPEARAAVLADLNGQVDKAYLQGKTDGSGAGILKTVGYFAAGFLGFVTIDKYVLNNKS